MRAPLKFQLIVARVIGILFINATCVDHSNHHVAVVCQAQSRLGLTETPSFHHEKLEQDLPLEVVKEGFEFDVNGQEQEKETSSNDFAHSIRENHRTIDHSRRRHYHHQIWPTDDHSNGMDNLGYSSRRINSLIDSLHSVRVNDVPQDQDVTNEDDDAPVTESFITRENDGDHDQNNVYSTSEVDSDKHEYQHQSHDTMRHYGDPAQLNLLWCSSAGSELDRYCHQLEAQNYSEALRVCGSDGKFHKSICDFKRRACRSIKDNHQLLQVVPNSYCVSMSAKSDFGCLKDEYEQFKLALLNEFNEDVELMFKYLDSNQNGFIEARELWPRSKNEADKLATRTCDDCYQPANDEYAFEPRFDWNPCSLSHLLLYENKSSLTQSMLSEVFSLFKHKTPPHETGANNGTRNESSIEMINTKVRLNMGESKTIDCLPASKQSTLSSSSNEPDCLWTRYGVNLGTIRDEHVTLERPSSASKVFESVQRQGPLQLHLEDAQLYLSGPYKCTCVFGSDSQEERHDQQQQTIQHQVSVQVLAQPRVSIRPKFQWSLPDSRIAFECHHDFIDTTNFDHAANNNGGGEQPKSIETSAKIDGAKSSGYKLKWSRDNQHWIVDSKEYNEQQGTLAPSSSRVSIIPASGRLVLERVQVNDTGRYYCLVEQLDDAPDDRMTAATSVNESAGIISSGENFGQLLVQDRLESMLDSSSAATAAAAAVVVSSPSDAIKYLWSFHENGISVYKLRADDGQELELVRELAGHSPVSGEVDGNWNQLTLCGGLNPDQVVICEWSDNALVVEVPRGPSSSSWNSADGSQPPMAAIGREYSNGSWPPAPASASAPDKYIYVGQPNLNRVIVMDGQAHEIVAIINTEPQPRKLYSFRPNKIHLSKWVRRRLSPLANARWLKAIDEQQNAKQQQSRAHPLKLTPKSSLLYSDKRQAKENDARFRRHSQANWTTSEHRSPPPPKLVQHDIWLLCYGQPLVVDPSSDLSELVVDIADQRAIIQADSHGPSSSSFHDQKGLDGNGDGRESAPIFTPLVPAWPLIGPHWGIASIMGRSKPSEGPSPLSSSTLTASSKAQPYSANKEARLRNRKSVQIIQSTFFPAFSNPTMHHHNKQQIDRHPSSSTGAPQAVSKFKRLTVLTTHYVIASHRMSSASDDERSYLNTKVGHDLRVPQFDLVQSLSVPQVPHSQRENHKFKLHHAYVTHYDERQLYRISMDSYRYDKEIDLSDCDPVSLISASLGLLIVQCRSPITHKLVGQLVLDELTSRTIQLNENIKAQESCLTPDNRYLISIHTNQSSTIYVQSVKVNGLGLLYEIKTTLETTQCSFVWRDGYYAAIFVALNRRDRQSELLSLRLADSRLELIVRVPGLMSSTMRHKEPLNVEPELQIVSLSTDSGVHIIDLEENRIIQTIDRRHQQTIPTLLWV